MIVAKRDRLTRKFNTILEIESEVIKKGAKVISASGEGTEDEEPSSVLLRRTIDAIAEYEHLIAKIGQQKI